MAIQARITRPLLVEALQVRKGNVSAAAEDLGISRRHVHNLLNDFGIDADAYRPGKAITAYGVHSSPEIPPHSENSGAGEHGGNRVRAEVWRERRPGNKFVAAMQRVGDVVVAAGEDVAAAIGRKASQPIRLREDQNDMIRSGRRHLNAAWEADLTDSDVARMYLDWKNDFDQFMTEMLAKKRAKPPSAFRRKGLNEGEQG